MPELLTDVINIGGCALEAEDRELRGIYRTKGQHGGLLRTDFERYYQFVVWKSLLEKYDAQIEYRHEGSLVDLVINQNEMLHIFEMKKWQEEGIRKIIPDIPRIQKFQGGGYLLIFSANPEEFTAENLRWFEEQLREIEPPACIHSFETKFPIHIGKPYEFWFAGWKVRPRAR